MSRTWPLTAVLKLVAGVVIWALHFATVTSFTALACARGVGAAAWWGASVVGWGVGAAGAVALTALGAVIASNLRAPTTGFVEKVSTGIAALAALAIVWETLPVTLEVPCR